MENLQDIIHRFLIANIAILAIFEATILFIKTAGNRARRVLAYLILM